MTSGMPELGSKISLISKADIRYEGRLFTVDPQECTIALAKVQSFGTEDRETQYPVAPQNQVYEYILFRGSDIKDIRVLNNVSSLPNDPAIMQMSVPPSMGVGGTANQFSGTFNHPMVNQTQYPQYQPMAGFPSGVHAPINKTSELSPQTTLDLAPQPPPVTAPIGSGVVHHANQVKDQGSMLDLIGGGSQQSTSRAGTPSGQRKSPTTEQGTQAGNAAGGSQRRGSGSGGQKPNQVRNNRPNSHTRQRYPSGGQPNQPHQPHQVHQPMQPHQGAPQHHHQGAPQHHHQGGQGYNHNRGGWRGRGRGGRGRGGFMPRNNKTLKFENDYDFEQANTEFEELRSKLAKAKISDGDSKQEGNNEVDKKDDSGNETGAGETEQEDEIITPYDKNKSFFDTISCEAKERSKGRSQRTDWRNERRINSETFGVASARRGAWRGRGPWRHHNPHGMHAQHNPMHQPGSYFPSWRSMRGGRGRGTGGNRPRNATAGGSTGQPSSAGTAGQPVSAAPQPQPQPATAAAK